MTKIIPKKNNTLKFNALNIIEKIGSKMRASGWSDLLKSVLSSTDMIQIISQLHQMVVEGKRFTPPLKDMFSAFEYCNFQDIKMIVIGTSPQEDPGVADGMALSGNTMNPVTSDFLLGLEEYLGTPCEVTRLEEIARQGVLLLNMSLSTRIGKKNAHIQLWDPFFKYLIDMLNHQFPDLIWVLVGKQPQNLADLISSSSIYPIEQRGDWKFVLEKASEIMTKRSLVPVNWKVLQKTST